MWGWSVAPLWRPIMELLRHTSDIWGKHQQWTLKGLVQNVYWRQARVAAHDPSIPTCYQLCHRVDGTLFHRRFVCDAHRAWRRAFLGQDLQRAAEEVALIGPSFTELFARGLFADVAELYERPPRTADMKFRCTASWHDLGPFLEGGSYVFVDGSGVDLTTRC